jgi:repressor of nif and glnA expression
MAKAKLNGVFVVGNVSEPVCEIDVDLNRAGMILVGGLNPIAAVEESGLEVETHAMSTVVDYKDLFDYEELAE